MHAVRFVARQAVRATARLSLPVAAGAAVLNLAGEAFHRDGLAQLTMGWLVPPLAAYVVARGLHVRHLVGGVVAGRRRGVPGRAWTVAWMVAALLCCWFGDLLDQVLPKLAAFLIGHICFGAAWWRWRRHTALARPGRRGPALICAATVVVVMVALLGPHVGAMILPMAAYAVCICVMALLATGLGWAGTLGGALFVLSDALLAIDWFVRPVPMSGVVIMAAYIAAQWLLVCSTVRRLTSGEGQRRHTPRPPWPAPAGRSSRIPPNASSTGGRSASA